MLSHIGKGLPPDKRREWGSLCAEQGFCHKTLRQQAVVELNPPACVVTPRPDDLDRNGVVAPRPDDPDRNEPAVVGWHGVGLPAPGLDDLDLVEFRPGLEEELGDDFDVDVIGHGFGLDG